MALNREDKADVSKAMGKALANKVAKVTRDSKPSKEFKQAVRNIPGAKHKSGGVFTKHSYSGPSRIKYLKDTHGKDWKSHL